MINTSTNQFLFKSESTMVRNSTNGNTLCHCCYFATQHIRTCSSGHNLIDRMADLIADEVESLSVTIIPHSLQMFNLLKDLSE